MRLCDWCGKPANVFRPVRRLLPNGTAGGWADDYRPEDDWLPSLAYQIVWDGCEDYPVLEPGWYVSKWQTVCLDRCGT